MENLPHLHIPFESKPKIQKLKHHVNHFLESGSFIQYEPNTSQPDFFFLPPSIPNRKVPNGEITRRWVKEGNNHVVRDFEAYEEIVEKLPPRFENESLIKRFNFSYEGGVAQFMKGNWNIIWDKRDALVAYRFSFYPAEFLIAFFNEKESRVVKIEMKGNISALLGSCFCKRTKVIWFLSHENNEIHLRRTSSIYDEEITIMEIPFVKNVEFENFLNQGRQWYLFVDQEVLYLWVGYEIFYMRPPDYSENLENWEDRIYIWNELEYLNAPKNTNGFITSSNISHCNGKLVVFPNVLRDHDQTQFYKLKPYLYEINVRKCTIHSFRHSNFKAHCTDILNVDSRLFLHFRDEEYITELRISHIPIPKLSPKCKYSDVIVRTQTEGSYSNERLSSTSPPDFKLLINEQSIYADAVELDAVSFILSYAKSHKHKTPIVCSHEESHSILIWNELNELSARKRIRIKKKQKKATIKISKTRKREKKLQYSEYLDHIRSMAKVREFSELIS